MVAWTRLDPDLSGDDVGDDVMVTVMVPTALFSGGVELSDGGSQIPRVHRRLMIRNLGCRYVVNGHGLLPKVL
jgi:hypothetical protein